MEYPGWPRRPHRTLCMPMTGVMLMMAALVLLSCGMETTFPENPEMHRLTEEQKKWPDKYYGLVESGVSSRIMGIRSPGEPLASARAKIIALLSQVKAQWSSIESLSTADALVVYFRTHQLTPIAEAIEQTLVANTAQEPTGAQHPQLQAAAIKAGLAFAHKEVTGETLK
jgi:hypothetical protein